MDYSFHKNILYAAYVISIINRAGSNTGIVRSKSLGNNFFISFIRADSDAFSIIL